MTKITCTETFAAVTPVVGSSLSRLKMDDCDIVMGGLG
jgi:hypothetical protein